MKRLAAATCAFCGCLAGQLQLASVVHADAFQQPCYDIGRIGHNAPGNSAGDILLVCDTATHTWFMLPMMPRVAYHDAGKACNPIGSEALSQDNNYLLTCTNGLWVNGTS